MNERALHPLSHPTHLRNVQRARQSKCNPGKPRVSRRGKHGVKKYTYAGALSAQEITELVGIPSEVFTLDLGKLGTRCVLVYEASSRCHLKKSARWG